MPYGVVTKVIAPYNIELEIFKGDKGVQRVQGI